MLLQCIELQSYKCQGPDHKGSAVHGCAWVGGLSLHSACTMAVCSNRTRHSYCSLLHEHC